MINKTSRNREKNLKFFCLFDCFIAYSLIERQETKFIIRLKTYQFSGNTRNSFTDRAIILLLSNCLGPPRIKKPYLQYGLNGEAVKVECLIESVPPPTRILWSHNSQVCYFFLLIVLFCVR